MTSTAAREWSPTGNGWPERFEAALPPRYGFYVVTRLDDGDGRFEQAFVEVDGDTGDSINGRIANELNVVRGYRSGDRLTLAESDIVERVIIDADGIEEGSIVGKLMNTYLPAK